MSPAESRTESLSHAAAGPLQAALLADRGVVRVAGPDAAHLLQGILTQDVALAETHGAIFTGLLSPQGKILFDFFLVAAGTDFLIDCPRALAPDLIKRLTLYRLRAKVAFTDESAMSTVFALWGTGSPSETNGAICFADPRAPDLGWRAIVPRVDGTPPAGATASSEAAWLAHRISVGVPEGGRDFAYGDAFPHETDMDQLAGVSFTKGCYVGQEVVSRMQHRGTARKRIVRIRGTAPLVAGAAIVADDATIGTVGSVAGDVGLAMVRLDRAAEASRKGASLRAGDIAITLEKPAWARFELVPQSTSEHTA